MKEANPFLRAALGYAQLGWPVFPIKPQAKQPPLTQHGCLDASLEEKQIREWWKKYPHANIGVRTGVAHWALDVDGKADRRGDLTLAKLESLNGKIGSALTQITPNHGWHYLFAPPEMEVIHGGQAVCGWKGIDVRAEGGYILVAPSVILTDEKKLKAYLWDGVDPLHDLFALNPAAPWLVEKLLARNGQPPGAEHPMGERIEHGVQHDTIRQFLMGMRKLGATREMLFAAAWEANQKNCDEPDKTPGRMHKMVDWVMKKIVPQPGHPPEGPPPSAVREKSKMSYHADCAEPVAIIDPILYPGLTILGGRPKAGKSWLALQLAIAVVNQLKLGGYLVVQQKSRCLYVSLEDRKPQLKKRLHHLVPDGNYLEDLDLIYDLEPLLAGGAAQLDETLQKDPVNVLIIDSLLAAVQAAGRKNVDIMQADYNIIRTLRELATKHAIALLLIAHTRKAAGPSLDLIQGTSGTTAAADAVWVLQRTPEGKATLTVTGREVPESVFGLERATDSPAWIITGEGDEVTQSDARQDIIQLLRDKCRPAKEPRTGKVKPHPGMTPTAIAHELKKNISGVKRLLTALCDLGLVVRKGRGNYGLAGEDEPDEAFE